MERIKLIWDFYGPDAEKTAEHHSIHLDEYAKREQLSVKEAGIEKISDRHTLAFLIVKKDEMIKVRDSLRPQRGAKA